MVQTTSLRDQIEAYISEIETLVGGIDEENAAARSGEEWSVKENLSHLAGPPGSGQDSELMAFLTQDMPTIDITPGVSYFDGSRENASVTELLSEVSSLYRDLGDWLQELTDEQLDRKAHIPFLKDNTPLDEDQTLREWAGIVVNLHLKGHVDQIREACS